MPITLAEANRMVQAAVAKANEFKREGEHCGV